MHLISVIIPIYNVELHLKQCVDSVVNQTYENIEIILVDDGSTDECPKICDNYGLKDKRIQVIHKINGGLSSARNAGLDVARGKYVGFIDGDDSIESDMYESLLHASLADEAEISMCGRYYVSENGLSPFFTMSEKAIWEKDEVIKNILTWNNIDCSVCDKLFNIEIFEDLRFPYGRITEDVFLFPQILKFVKRIAHIGSPKYLYTIRPNSISKSTVSKSSLDMLDSHKNFSDYVIRDYPQYKVYAEYFFYQVIARFIIRVFTEIHPRDSIESQYMYNEAANLLKKYKYSIFSNKIISIRNKLKILLINFNLFHILISNDHS